jgi:hypothetical protein
VHLVGFIIRIYHGARSCECQKLFKSLGMPLVGIFKLPAASKLVAVLQKGWKFMS